MKLVVSDGGRKAAGYKGTAGDCVCRAVAIASGRPYREVYEALADVNARTPQSKRRKHGKPGRRTARDGIFTQSKLFDDYMTSIGFVWTPTMQIGSGCRVHLREDELPMGRLVVSVSKHMCAVIDGVLHDTDDCTRNGKRCVYGYYQLKGI